MAAVTPRQYRPTYSHLPAVAHPRPQIALAIPQPGPVHARRRLTGNFPSIVPLHSCPTVAASTLTASTSCNDIINPTSRVSLKPLPATPNISHRRTTPFPFESLDRRDSNGMRGIVSENTKRTVTPTRIPTPIPRAKVLIQKRFVTTPAPFLSKREKPVLRFLASKENLFPDGYRPLTKSRTMNALNSVCSALTRSNSDLKALMPANSGDSTPELKPNPRGPTSTPLPPFTTNVRQISTAMPSTYWAGRFTALYDRFRSEILSREDLLDSPFFRKLLLRPNSLISKTHGVILDHDGKVENQNPNPHLPFDYETTEHIKQAKRAFTHLEALCLTKEAENSLRSFRISFARLEGNNELLPPGVKLNEDPDGRYSFMARAGRIFSGSGRKSAFGNPLNKSKSRSGLRMSTGGIGR